MLLDRGAMMNSSGAEVDEFDGTHDPMEPSS
jgi:hypothetical protein